MSHSKEREEKICLNCGAHLNGRYCYKCGQENTEPKETVWGLVSHFFNDITHFDGKFFSTVKYLIIKPGFLSSEYIKGRRASYLHPIRMYVFTSAFFFIIFFSLFNPDAIIRGKLNEEEQLKDLTEANMALKDKLAKTDDADDKAAIQRAEINIDRHLAVLQKSIAAKAVKDSARIAGKKGFVDSATAALKDNPYIPADLTGRLQKMDSSTGKRTDSLVHKKKKRSADDNDFDLGNMHIDYHSQTAYDSVQKELPEGKKAGWFERSMAHKAILYNTKWKSDKKELIALFLEKFLHTLPQALFVSLPVFAFILLMLYARRNFYYVDHGIFTIHLYCANFIILLLIFGFDKLREVTGWSWLTVFDFILPAAIFFYLYKAMRNFYRQRRSKTILKFLVLVSFSFIIVLVLTAAFFLLSLMQFS